MSAAAVSEATFGREVLGAAIPVLVEFSAARVPSNAALDNLSSELDDRVKVTRVDVDQDPTLKDEYAVRGLPALVLFKYGKPVARTVGLLSISRLREWIDDALILALATARVSAARPVTNFTLANGLEVVVIPTIALRSSHRWSGTEWVASTTPRTSRGSRNCSRTSR
jgi:thioredoxin 1